jgi:hypothetical protein
MPGFEISTCSSTSAGISAMVSRRETSPSRTAIALAPIDISTLSWATRVRFLGSTSTSSEETAAAAIKRSSSQRSLKLAIDGTKITISANNTKAMVNSSSLVDKPRDSGTSSALLASVFSRSASPASMHQALIQAEGLRRCDRPTTRAMARIGRLPAFCQFDVVWGDLPPGIDLARQPFYKPAHARANRPARAFACRGNPASSCS